MIEVLPAPSGVLADHLHATGFGWINRDVRPRRRNAKMADADKILLRDLARVGRSVAEATLGRPNSQNAVRMNPLDRSHESFARERSCATAEQEDEEQHAGWHTHQPKDDVTDLAFLVF
jgi:hypothetical protein